MYSIYSYQTANHRAHHVTRTGTGSACAAHQLHFAVDVEARRLILTRNCSRRMRSSVRAGTQHSRLGRVCIDIDVDLSARPSLTRRPRPGGLQLIRVGVAVAHAVGRVCIAQEWSVLREFGWR